MGEQRLYTYSANEIRICADVKTATVRGPRRAARAPTGSALGRFMVSGGGGKGGFFFGPDLNHD